MAKRSGCRIFISTGRPLQWVRTSALAPILPLVDGFITLNGALAVVNNQVCFSTPIDLADVRLLLDDARRCNYACVLMGIKHISIFNEQPVVRPLFEQFLQLGGVEFPPSSDSDIPNEPILQISPFFTVEQENRIVPQLSRIVCTRWHPAFGDVNAPTATKGEALRSILSHLKLPASKSIAFGDGGNDISMLRAVGVGVAMGGALDHVKAEADMVAPPVEEDGIARVLQDLEVITDEWQDVPSQ